MASVERELEEQLKEVGSRLLQPPALVDELLPLLDQVENFLSRVEQSPSKSMQTALSPSMKALVADQLLRHPDVDVQVAVASCISEITRITAPDAPYDDDRMKDIFKLIVSSFENLSDKSSRSYSKRTLILETVAKVRSCVVMLDLECDGLIVEMFEHFLRAIRDYHPENVFSSMETIMTLVLEESEDISLELISSILASVKRDNQEFLPIARKLGERVFENCAVKLKPYLIHAKKSLGLSLDNYSKVIASMCDGATRPVGHNDDNACGGKMAEDSKLAGTSSGGADQADEDKVAEASTNDAAQDQVTKESMMGTHTGGDNPDVDGSLKLVMSNGIAEAGNEDILADQKSSKEPEHAHQADQSADTNVASNAEPADLYSGEILESESKPVDLDSGKILKSEAKSEQTSKKRGRKQKPLNNASDFHRADPSADTNVSSNAEPGDLDSGKILESESKPYDLDGGKILKSEAESEQTSKKSGRKHKSSSDATDSHQADLSADANVTSNAEPGDLDSEKIPESESKPDNLDSGRILQSESKPDDLDSGKILKSEAKSEQTSKKRGRKQKSLNNSTEPSESSQIDRDKETEIMADCQRSRSKEVRKSPYEEPAVEVSVPSENDNETAQPSSPKALESESMNVASSSPSGFVADDGHPKKTGRPKKKGNLIRKDSPPAASVSKKASEGKNDSEAKSRRRKGKSAPAVNIIEVKNPVLADASEREGGSKSDSDSKPLKQSGRKVDVTDGIGNGSSSKKMEDGGRHGRRKSTLEKKATKSSAKDDDKEMFSSPKAASKLAKHEGRSEATPTINSKRKRTPRKEEASDDNTKYGDNLVGLTIKVWWPEDQTFYEGVVDSFDPVKKKHTILYKDGDKEILVLKKERWEPVGGDSSNVEQAIENRSADPSPEMQKKKKAKTISEPSVKQGKLESLRSGEASSSKSKGVAAKSGRKSRDANSKIEGTLKDDTCNSGGKSDKAGGKSDKASVKSGRAAKTASKSKGGDDGGTPKSTEDTPKTATKDSLKSFIKETPKTSKGKASKSAKKSKINVPGKMKSGSVNVKETKGMEKSPEAVTPEGKSPDTSKLQETGTKSAKSGKKRRRN